jgi:hypothetical protein
VSIGMVVLELLQGVAEEQQPELILVEQKANSMACAMMAEGEAASCPPGALAWVLRIFQRQRMQKMSGAVRRAAGRQMEQRAPIQAEEEEVEVRIQELEELKGLLALMLLADAAPMIVFPGRKGMPIDCWRPC